MRTPVAVTFDFWDTLVRAPRNVEGRSVRRRRLSALFVAEGATVDEEALDASLAALRRHFDERWEANDPYSGEEAVSDLLSTLGLDQIDHGRAVAAFTGSDDPATPPLTDNVAAVLDELSRRGVRLGIICDVGLQPSPVLRTFLERHGVLGYFDHWSFSDEVGVYKPDPKIFAHALDGLGVDDPATAAHIGDLRRTDVAGARAFGMTSVRYAGANDDVVVPDEGDRAHLGFSGVEPADRIEADHVITDHRDLFAVLGFT